VSRAAIQGSSSFVSLRWRSPSRSRRRRSRPSTEQRRAATADGKTRRQEQEQEQGQDKDKDEEEKKKQRRGMAHRSSFSFLSSMSCTLDDADKTCPKCGGGLHEMKDQFEEAGEIDHPHALGTRINSRSTRYGLRRVRRHWSEWCTKWQPR
jgi:hypothetical protein